MLLFNATIGRLILIFAFGLLWPITKLQATQLDVSEQEAKLAIKAFAKELATRHGFDEAKVATQLLSLEPRTAIIERMRKPAEAMPWHRYRKIFLTEKRINQGVAFWQEHAATLEKAEQTFGVDPAMIVAIIGVETFYGRIQGTFPVLEALHTLGFYYPERSAFFKSELAQYYQLARDQGWQLDNINGSYAGAMGMGQFISSSYRHYGYDFNGDGEVNLFSDPVDMIGSVANYFKKHRWQKGGFVGQKVSLAKEHKDWVQSGLALKRDFNGLKKAVLPVNEAREDLGYQSQKGGIFAFEQASGNQDYWLVGDNFYAITRYNHSPLYALAAFQLSQAIAQARARQADIAGH